MSPLGSTMPQTTNKEEEGRYETLLQNPRQDDQALTKLSNHHNDNSSCSNPLLTLCRSLQADPVDLLRLESVATPDDDEVRRGVYLKRPIRAGDAILILPLESCLVDHRPPSWLQQQAVESPGKWATRLAACWIDLFLENSRNGRQDEKANPVQKGHMIWLSLLQDLEYLKASLPVHWPEEIVQNARSTNLEAAVDSAFFVRTEAVQDLVDSLVESPYTSYFDDTNNPCEEMRSVANRALDIVQTRSCRLETRTNEEPCRVLAPIFDFINHDDSNPNASFELESVLDDDKKQKNKFLVVRALQNLNQDDEVLIDYGECARPAWKCLMSYGFVPKFNKSKPEDNVAEVYMMGQRYEVTADTIPIEMVIAALASTGGGHPKLHLEDEDTDTQEEQVTLTAEVARRIAERVEDVGFFLLLESDLDPYEAFDEGEDMLTLAPTDVLSHKLAASLRWSQHKVLMACANGLRRFAEEEEETTVYR
jgi:hypothetical protein